LHFDDALKIKSLPPELIEPITQTRDDVLKQQDALIEKLVDAVEKSREFRTMEALDDNSMGSQKQKIEELQIQSGSLAKRAMHDLESLLGPELYSEFIKEKEATNNAQHQIATVVTERNGRIITETELAEGTSSHADRKQKDQYLPDSVSPSNFNQYVSLLELKTEDQFIVDILYQEYREIYDKALYEPLQDEVQEDDSQELEATENIINVDELRKQRIAELQEIDNRLFDDIALIVKAEQQNNTL